MTQNYRRGVGQLATSRYDFQNHIDGYGFQHPGGAVSCSVTIGGTPYTDVQSALTAISGYVPVIIPNATASVTGGIRLTGDLGGTYNSPIVSKLNTKLISYTSFTSGDVLTWNGSVWTNAQLAGDVNGSVISNTVSKIQGRTVSNNSPVTNQMIYWSGSQWQPGYPTFGGTDLLGASNNISVIRATGLGSDPYKYFEVKCPSIYFSQTLTYDASISFIAATGTGRDLTISAQNSSTIGGQLNLQGGSSGTGLDGGVVIKKKTGAVGLIHAKEVQSYAEVGSRDVVALCPDTNSLGIRARADCGDRVVYLGDAATDPTPGTSSGPLNGVILYSSNGALNVMEEDGYARKVASYETVQVYYDYAEGAATGGFVTSQSYSDFSSGATPSFFFSGRSAGEMLKIKFSGRFSYTGFGSGYIRCLIADTGGNLTVPGFSDVLIVDSSSSSTERFSIDAIYYLPRGVSNGSIKIQGKASIVSGSLGIIEDWFFIVEVLRP